MTEARARRIDTQTDRLDRAFGARDAKGREIGGRAWIGTSAIVELPDEASTFWRVDASRIGTTEFFFEPHATRDGNSFGALQGRRYFPSIEARDAAVAKYFAAAEKRAAKAAR